MPSNRQAPGESFPRGASGADDRPSSRSSLVSQWRRALWCRLQDADLGQDIQDGALDPCFGSNDVDVAAKQERGDARLHLHSCAAQLVGALPVRGGAITLRSASPRGREGASAESTARAVFFTVFVSVEVRGIPDLNRD
jgi:hypothetical protein